MELQEALQECRMGYEHLSQRAIDAQVAHLLMLNQFALVKEKQ